MSKKEENTDTSPTIPERKRCPSMSPYAEGEQCGLDEGHRGKHTVLIPSGVPWWHIPLAGET